jgi:hypothetical protein
VIVTSHQSLRLLLIDNNKKRINKIKIKELQPLKAQNSLAQLKKLMLKKETMMVIKLTANRSQGEGGETEVKAKRAYS